VTYDDRPSVRVFDTRTKQPVATLYGGPPPQHVRFDDADGLARFGRYAYVSAGNSGLIRVFDWRTRRLVRMLATPKGSFNLSVDRGLLATSSLTQGVVSAFDGRHRSLSRRLASSTRDVAVVRP
jgi:hypothetical protein